MDKILCEITGIFGMGYDIENFHYKWKNQESLGIFILTFSKYALEMMEVFMHKEATSCL
jgi:hypothetical protein